jgi:hypothetical protein
MPFSENPPLVPPFDIPMTGPDGMLTQPWIFYFQNLSRYFQRLRAAIP